MVLRMTNFNFWGNLLKNLTFSRVFTRNQYRGEIAQKECANLRGGIGKKDGGDTPTQTMLFVYVYFLNIFFLFFIDRNVFFSFSFIFCYDISNICNRVLTSQKPEYVIRNCQWNCMCNSSVINIRCVSLPPYQLPKV